MEEYLVKDICSMEQSYFHELKMIQCVKGEGFLSLEGKKRKGADVYYLTEYEKLHNRSFLVLRKGMELLLIGSDHLHFQNSKGQQHGASFTMQ